MDLGHLSLDIKGYRDIWFKTSFLLDQKQAKTERTSAFENYKTKL
jgi:phosphoribosylformylglycinamidine synthase